MKFAVGQCQVYSDGMLFMRMKFEINLRFRKRKTRRTPDDG